MHKTSYEEIAPDCHIKPLRDFVVIKKTEKKQEGLIYVVKQDERILTGTICAKGHGVLTNNGEQHPIQLDLGDEVAFDRTQAVFISHQGQDYYVTNELSVRCILLPPKKKDLQ